MEFPNTSRNSSFFIQCRSEDGSLDYSADWDSFSFENELNTRENILREDLKAYNDLLNQQSFNTTDTVESIISDLQTNKEVAKELVTKNKNIFNKYEVLMKEHKQVKINLKVLENKKTSLDEIIKKLQEDETTSYKIYHQTEIALHKAKQMYTTYFDINISTKPLSDTTYEACLYFKGVSNPIKFVVDRENRKVIDFQCNEVLSPEEENNIRQEFASSQNLPNLLYALRNIVLKYRN